MDDGDDGEDGDASLHGSARHGMECRLSLQADGRLCTLRKALQWQALRGSGRMQRGVTKEPVKSNYVDDSQNPCALYVTLQNV